VVSTPLTLSITPTQLGPISRILWRRQKFKRTLLSSPSLGGAGPRETNRLRHDGPDIAPLLPSSFHISTKAPMSEDGVAMTTRSTGSGIAVTESKHLKAPPSHLR